MDKILRAAHILADRQKAKEIASRVQNKRSKGDYRCFADILQEEIAKEKATKDTDQDSPR